MRFKPTTEEELQQKEFPVYEPQYAYFIVTEAQDRISKINPETGKGGNPMIALTLDLELISGERIKIWDFLLEALPKKLKHFCDITGNDVLYSSGCVEAANCIAKEGWCYIEIQAANDKYKAKNVIADYVTQEIATELKQETTSSNGTGPFDDLSDIEL